MASQFDLTRFGECFEPGKLAFLMLNWTEIAETGRVFPGGEYGESLQNNKPCSFEINIFYYYEWKDPNTEEKRCLKIQLLQIRIA